MNSEEKIMIIHVEVIGNNSQFILLKFWQSCDQKKKKKFCGPKTVEHVETKLGY